MDSVRETVCRGRAAESDWGSSTRAGRQDLVSIGTNLNDDLQSVQDDDVGLRGQVAVDKSFVLQLSPSPSRKSTKIDFMNELFQIKF